MKKGHQLRWPQFNTATEGQGETSSISVWLLSKILNSYIRDQTGGHNLFPRTSSIRGVLAGWYAYIENSENRRDHD